MLSKTAYRPVNWLCLTLCFLALVGLCSCQATQNYRQAEKNFQKAQSAGAHIFAPFEYASAEVYLKMAKKLLRDSDFERSAKYSLRSLAFSEQALARALHSQGDAEKRPAGADRPPEISSPASENVPDESGLAAPAITPDPTAPATVESLSNPAEPKASPVGPEIESPPSEPNPTGVEPASANKDKE